MNERKPNPRGLSAILAALAFMPAYDRRAMSRQFGRIRGARPSKQRTGHQIPPGYYDQMVPLNFLHAHARTRVLLRNRHATEANFTKPV